MRFHKTGIHLGVNVESSEIYHLPKSLLHAVVSVFFKQAIGPSMRKVYSWQTYIPFLGMIKIDQI